MIDAYKFGKITIQGKLYTRDLKISNGKVIPDWWRKKGHLVKIEDISDIIAPFPEYLIIGQGHSKMMQISNKLLKYLEIKGIPLIALSTPKAVNRFNEMVQSNVMPAAAFHLTC